MRLNYSDLLDFFTVPESPSVLPPDLGAAGARSIELTPKAPSFFFPPALETESGSLDPVSFWMISAPAAVGKSTVARALAADLVSRRIQVVYIPLRGATIGDNFFGGLLAAVFPKQSKQKVIESLASGETVLIFDGRGCDVIAHRSLSTHHTWITFWTAKKASWRLIFLHPTVAKRWWYIPPSYKSAC